MNTMTTMTTGNTQLPPPPLPAVAASKPAGNRWALKVLVTIAVLGLAISTFTIASLALFTDTENVGANTFGTGTVDIAALPATAVFTPGPMAPGDQVAAEIDVSNNGTLDLRYALTSSTTEDVLAGTLDLTVKTGVTTCDNANWNADGAVLYNAGILGSTGTTAIFGDVTPGGDVGDRTLAPAASETLCLIVTLPMTATNASQGLSTTATFNFAAEQTANNP